MSVWNNKLKWQSPLFVFLTTIIKIIAYIRMLKQFIKTNNWSNIQNKQKLEGYNESVAEVLVCSVGRFVKFL